MQRNRMPKNPWVWREEAVARMAQSRSRTLAFLTRIPESEIIRRRTSGKWSIKDTLAHIVAWEEVAVMRLEQIMRGAAGEVVFYEDIKEADRFNARAVRHARSIPRDALLRGMEKVRARLIKRLLSLDPGELDNQAHRYAVVEWLPELAWTHEQSHLRRMQSWWNSKRKQSNNQA